MRSRLDALTRLLSILYRMFLRYLAGCSLSFSVVAIMFNVRIEAGLKRIRHGHSVDQSHAGFASSLDKQTTSRSRSRQVRNACIKVAARPFLTRGSFLSTFTLAPIVRLRNQSAPGPRPTRLYRRHSQDVIQPGRDSGVKAAYGSAA